MNDNKQFKDPVYGYIDIDRNVISSVIDTDCFQRLRDIIQTSYSPLYSSAVHNRFVHSLGVYHLGRIVSKAIKNFNYIDITELDRWLEIFQLACLLHDVGHAPFSHTGELYYLNNGERTILHNTIIQLTEDNDLRIEIGNKGYKAAPHELMSIIVSLKEFPTLFNSSEEKSFFARCISGYLFDQKLDKQKSFLNCLISLLNSSVIDVDKLDYLIRDAYITGFDTVVIDYRRLLNNIAIKSSNDTYILSFQSGAISVIENVVYAHDAERKWIQNHPVVLYEGFLLQRAIDEVQFKYTKTPIFSYEALTSKGVSISDDYVVRLMSDSDLVFLMKNIESDYIDEYYNRNKRRHPLWKSESEYKALFSSIFSDEMFDIFENRIEDFNKYLQNLGVAGVINDNALQACQNDINNIGKQIDLGKTELSQQLRYAKRHLEWINLFKDYSKEQAIPFDFVILKANQFNSGFLKEAFGKIQIIFSTLEAPRDFVKVTNVLKADRSTSDKFFYIFYRRHHRETKIDLINLVKKIQNKVTDEKLENY